MLLLPLVSRLSLYLPFLAAYWPQDHMVVCCSTFFCSPAFTLHCEQKLSAMIKHYIVQNLKTVYVYWHMNMIFSFFNV